MKRWRRKKEEEEDRLLERRQIQLRKREGFSWIKTSQQWRKYAAPVSAAQALGGASSQLSLPTKLGLRMDEALPFPYLRAGMCQVEGATKGQ